MNIAVVGKGAREEAIARKLINENNKVYLINENNIKNYHINMKTNEFSEIKKFCNEQNIELIIAGSEDLLVNGIADYFSGTNIKVFGPEQKYTFLEGSKIKAKNFMKRNGIQTALYTAFNKFDEDKIKKIIKQKNGNIVLKYDGLAAGKGVLISKNYNQALKNLETLKNKYNNPELLIEERLIGREISIMSVTNGKDIKIFQPSQDYKLSHNFNKGLNTGGMGAVTPLDFVTDDVLKEIKNKIITPTINGFKKESIKYRGFLYFGIILTERGPFLLEYNIRLGDPETQVLLPAMKTNLTDLLTQTLNGSLSKTEEIEFDENYHMALVLASKGYPLNYETNKPIKTDYKKLDCDILYAGVKKDENNNLLTNGGRVLNIVSSDKNMKNLIKKVYKCTENIDFENKYHRDDIGTIY